MVEAAHVPTKEATECFGALEFQLGSRLKNSSTLAAPRVAYVRELGSGTAGEFLGVKCEMTTPQTLLKMTATPATDEIAVTEKQEVENLECTVLVVIAAAGLDPIQNPEHEIETDGAGTLQAGFPVFANAAPSSHYIVELPEVVVTEDRLGRDASLAVACPVGHAVGRDEAIPVQQRPAYNFDQPDLEVEVAGIAVLENLHCLGGHGVAALEAEPAYPV